jgi:hypothetical protein
MNNKNTRRLEAFLRGQEFGHLQAARIPAGSFAAELFARLTQIITDIQAAADRQSSSRRAAQQGTTSKASISAELLMHLRAIARTARVMALMTPGLEDRFRFPRNARGQALMSTARTFATAAEPMKAEFIRRGLPADFLDKLKAAIAAYEQALTQQTQGAEERVAATAALDDLVNEGLRTMQELDAVMLNMFALDAATLAQWQSASRVERAPRRKKKEAVESRAASDKAVGSQTHLQS